MEVDDFPVLALFSMGSALTARAQVTYSARERKLPFTVGGGISDFSDDWGIKNPRQVGVGADVRFWNCFSVRAEYDYQFWHAIFGPHDLNPNGITVGVVYDFGRPSK